MVSAPPIMAHDPGSTVPIGPILRGSVARRLASIVWCAAVFLTETFGCTFGAASYAHPVRQSSNVATANIQLGS